jgi:hypothetical protein
VVAELLCLLYSGMSLALFRRQNNENTFHAPSPAILSDMVIMSAFLGKSEA